MHEIISVQMTTACSRGKIQQFSSLHKRGILHSFFNYSVLIFDVQEVYKLADASGRWRKLIVSHTVPMLLPHGTGHENVA